MLASWSLVDRISWKRGGWGGGNAGRGAAQVLKARRRAADEGRGEETEACNCWERKRREKRKKNPSEDVQGSRGRWGGGVLGTPLAGSQLSKVGFLHDDPEKTGAICYLFLSASLPFGLISATAGVFHLF